MTAAIWSGAGTASDVLLLCAAIVAVVDWLIVIAGRSELSRGLLTASVALIAACGHERSPLRTYQYQFSNHDCFITLTFTFPEAEAERWQADMAAVLASFDLVRR